MQPTETVYIHPWQNLLCYFTRALIENFSILTDLNCYIHSIYQFTTAIIINVLRLNNIDEDIRCSSVILMLTFVDI
jgi:hypothetical protein